MYQYASIECGLPIGRYLCLFSLPFISPLWKLYHAATLHLTQHRYSTPSSSPDHPSALTRSSQLRDRPHPTPASRLLLPSQMSSNVNEIQQELNTLIGRCTAHLLTRLFPHPPSASHRRPPPPLLICPCRDEHGHSCPAAAQPEVPDHISPTDTTSLVSSSASSHCICS